MTAHPSVTGSTDTGFDNPYIDVDEWRDEPLRHRYVHGGFEGTDTRFSMYFPPAERYQGRFFQPLMPVSGSEHAAASGVLTGMAGLGGHVGFACSSGAYLLESNLGRLDPFPGDDWTLTNYRASAAVARYSRVVAAEMYGDHRPYGYVFGGSGGAFKTICCMENVLGVWDGAVPFVQGTPVSIPNVFTVQSHAMRVLRNKFPLIVDALEPGGSGDMFAGLNAEERDALAEVTRMGFPPRAWFDVDRIRAGYTGVWSMLIDAVRKSDPEYFEDFWTVPGYLGADGSESLARERVQLRTTVAKTVTRDEADRLGLQLFLALRIGDWSDAPVAFRVADLPDVPLQGATVTIKSGLGAGRVLYITDVKGDIVLTGFGAGNSEGLRGVETGDEIEIDNSVYLAAQTYHRHQVHPGFGMWEQFMIGDKPIYPQRPPATGGVFPQSGRWAGKMIVVETLLDEAAYPIQALYYRRLVEAQLGDRLDDRYRLWFIDNAMHTTPMVGPDDPRPVRTTRTISYHGALQQALRDLVDWVEHDVAPPPSTTYSVADGQVSVPEGAADRGGIQPVVRLTVGGSDVIEVAVGETVEFHGVAETPPKAGTIVRAEWDFEGAGDFPLSETVPTGADGPLSRVKLTASHTFTEPGTYFPVLRVTGQRQSDSETLFGRVYNIARVRVIVR